MEGSLKLPDPEQFNFKDCIIAGDECWLITPKHMGVDWNDDNARFRSCIVRKSDNYVVSQGYKKFVNLFEKPEFQPWVGSWPIRATLKRDGSCLIVSKYKDETIIRTRGTISARELPNGDEIDLLIQKYPKAFDNMFLDGGYSLLLEWSTPTNIIVYKEFDEPTLILTGIVDNETATYWHTSELSKQSYHLEVCPPEYYQYDTLSDCIKDVELWEGKEGVVLYSPCGQILKKLKANLYLELHKISTGIKNVNNVLDVFMESPGFVTYQGFYNYIEQLTDYEVAEKCKLFIHQIIDAYNTFLQTYEKMEKLIKTGIQFLDTRKEQAQEITLRWSGWNMSLAFIILDGKEVDDKLIRKALENIIENEN